MLLFTQNGKMKKSGNGTYAIYNFGIPAYRSEAGFKTCPSAGSCKDYCYGKKGHYTSSRVSEVYELRLKHLKLDNFKDIANIHLQNLRSRTAKTSKKLAIRLFDIGDIYSLSVLKKLAALCEDNDDIIFYHYTKQVSLIKKYFAKYEKPTNLISIFSFGGTEDRLIDKTTDRHSQVFKNLNDLKSNGYADASSDDSVAFTSNNHKIGLVYH